MAFPVVPEQVPSQSTITTQLMTTPIVASWYLPQSITQIPEATVGWLVAQGWQITGINYDQTTQPPTPYYTMDRTQLQTELILQHFLGEAVFAYNSAIKLNELRYNEVVIDWRSLISSSHDYHADQGEVLDTFTTAYALALDEFMDDVESVIAETSTALGLAETTAIGAAEALNDKLLDLELNYNVHADLARGFLTGLGTTELARINEEFTASLSNQLQDLTDKGLYSSSRAADVTARNTRDRDEQVSALNDRLNREKLGNEHTLYGQLTDAVQGFMAGKAQYAALTTSTMGAVGSQRSTVVGQKMGTYAVRLEEITSNYQKSITLMQYMLDERNKLVIGMQGFVERRDDIGPTFREVAQIAVGLGDVGGGWLSP